MISILINAYACSPHMGSEQGMSWHWITNLANYCKVFVITEGEYQDKIEKALEELPQRENIHFYFNPVSEKVRKICWKQGDWRFYYYYNLWQKGTYRLALEIMKEQSIDVVHHLNMIGFREPGYLWKITSVPYVWGPIGGMENIPISYLQGEGIKLKMIVLLKTVINNYQARYSTRVRKALKRADALIAAVKGVKDKVEKVHNKQITLINETGCYPGETLSNPNMRQSKMFNIIWVGKFDFRKQLGVALHSIANVKNLEGLNFHIVGSGSKQEVSYYQNMAKELGLRNVCRWHGIIPNDKVQELMRSSDLLFFSSIMEGTPHVVLEAIGNNLPVLCLNACGQSATINGAVGIKVEVTSTKQSVIDFTEKLLYLNSNRALLNQMSKACSQRQIELSWDSKVKEMVNIYQKILHDKLS